MKNHRIGGIDDVRSTAVILLHRNAARVRIDDIEIKNVAIEDLRSAPYRARIEFYKIVTSPIDHSELKRELWTANVVYVFRDQVPNDMLLVNPLGLTITYFREDQAFEK